MGTDPGRRGGTTPLSLFVHLRSRRPTHDALTVTDVNGRDPAETSVVISTAFDGRASIAASTAARAHTEPESKDAVGGLPDQAIPFDPVLRARIASPNVRPLPVDLRARALVLWPRLDRARLTRTKGDPIRIARLVTRRSSLTFDGILAVLTKGVDGLQEVDPAKCTLPRDDLSIQIQSDSTDEERNDGRSH